MPIEVRVGDNIHGGWNLSIYLISLPENATGDRYVLHLSEKGMWSNDKIDPGIAVEPSFTIEEPYARALCDALVNRFNGSEDTRLLRKDYEHEKGRVDKLIEYITKIIS